jgi:ATP-dependent exoDNAse (exonuclease V) alpha subunit
MPHEQAGREARTINGVSIEINDDFQRALEILENTGRNVFITGRAGTGKSTLLEYFRMSTKKSIAVLAPTGVAALNVRGQTIHSFFRFRPNITPDTVKRLPKRLRRTYESVDAIVIDEISMVRADLLDCIDAFMRLNGKNPSKPFGGVQMILIGDLYQLPPVVTNSEAGMFNERYKGRYFFDAQAFGGLHVAFLELEKNYRQTDRHFITILNSIRNNTATEKQLDALNARLDQPLAPRLSEGHIILTTTNALADRINQEHMKMLKGESYTYAARFGGGFDSKSVPADEVLTVKVGAQVMLLNNDKGERWVNGSLGTIVAIRSAATSNDANAPDHDINQDIIVIKLAGGPEVQVLRNTWELFRFSYDPTERKLVPSSAGSFTQYPIMPAWAVTIHKSQGKTFGHVIIDIGDGTFTHGQLYVALSRCTTLEGITLKRRLEKKHVMTDPRIVEFLTRYQYGQSEAQMSLEEKVRIIRGAIKDMGKIELVYLKPNDEKSTRIVIPSSVGAAEYLGKKYIGMTAMDSKSGEQRNFRVDRIIDMKLV